MKLNYFINPYEKEIFSYLADSQKALNMLEEWGLLLDF